MLKIIKQIIKELTKSQVEEYIEQPYTIEEDILCSKIEMELTNTIHLKHFLSIEQFILNQAKAESNLFTYATRYERHIEDFSVGIFQLLTNTAKWLGYEGKITGLFDIDTQVQLAIKYLDYLYGRFPEIRDTHNRLQFAFLSYNCGIGNVNRLLRLLRDREGVVYAGEHTIQGNWSNFNIALENLYIVTGSNSEISRRYINRIF